MSVTGNLFIIAAPSGAGKTTLVNALLEKTSDLVVSISHTTRPMRPKEADGKNYFFVNEGEFEQMISRGEFLEHARVFGNYYGTSRKWVERELAQGLDVILEIDWQGAEQVKLHFPQAISVFILPPSIHALRERLNRRQQDDPEVIERRINEAKEEISHCTDFDYLVVNQRFQNALTQLRAIFTAARARNRRFILQHQDLLGQLLAD